MASVLMTDGRGCTVSSGVLRVQTTTVEYNRTTQQCRGAFEITLGRV